MKSLLNIFVFFILLFIFAKWGPSLPFSTTTQNRGEPLIVSGTGKVFVTPDIAKVLVGIEESGPVLKDTQNQVNAKSQSLTEALKKLGIGESDIKTRSYHVYPEYDYNRRPNAITGYRISTGYEVKIKDFDKVNEVLVKTTEAGANVIGNIYFEVNDKTKKEKLQEAREMAVKEAKEKASSLANATGITLGKIINISESGGYQQRLYTNAAGGTPEEKISTPAIEPGETELSVTVSLSFETR